MRNIRILILVLISTTVFGIAGLKAQSETQMVLIRTVEYFGSAVKSEMVTITPSKETSIVELKRGGAKNLGENGVVIQQEIIKWQQQGFVITNFSTDGGDSSQRTFIIMTKE